MKQADEQVAQAAQPLPAALRLVVSKLTDTRYLQQRLRAAGIAVELETLSMASSEQREHFRQLQRRHQWHSLPMVFAGELRAADGANRESAEFIGGELEVLQRLPTEAGSRA